MRIARFFKNNFGCWFSLSRIDIPSRMFPTILPGSLPLSKEPVVPKDLWGKCFKLICASRSSVAFEALPAMIAQKENAVILQSLSFSREVIRNGRSLLVKRLNIWLFYPIIAAAAWVYSPWILCASTAVFIIDRLVARGEKYLWILLASVLLSVEVLANNFAGWGVAYPDDRRKALYVLDCTEAEPQTTWLDYYFPKRAKMDAELLEEFGPESKN